jgi:LmbE family N-acetylglucosaminyl deacetylase
MLKLDILVLPVHPDDAELGCAGTILKHMQLGHKVGIIDLTRGELGTRGTAEIRDQEAAKAAEILGLTIRENLGLPDGFFDQY